MAWFDVCQALGMANVSRALPVYFTCPLCHKPGSLVICNDTIYGGQWHHCPACGAAGDMIDLACAVWHMTPLAATLKLAEAGVSLPSAALLPEFVDNYTRAYSDHRQQINQLWRKASAGGQSCSNIHARYIGNAQLDASSERWMAGPGKLFGGMHVKALEAAFGVERRRHIFRGKGWDHVVVVPYYDMPDRIKAFGCLGRDGNPQTDYVFKCLSDYSPHHEAGLAFASTVADAGRCPAILATDDWVTALYIHMRGFRTSGRPLPLVAWYDDGRCRTKTAWEMFAGRKVVFWTQAIDYRLVMQAMEVDGYITTGDRESVVDSVQIRKYTRDIGPTSDLARKWVNTALPWPEALKRWLLTADEGARLEMFARLEQAGADVSRIYRCLGGSELSRVPLQRSSLWRGKTIYERDDRWQISEGRAGHGKSVTDVCNATLRLLNVIKDKSSKEIYYYGSIRHKGKEVQFVEKLETVMESTEPWMKKKMLDAEMGLLLSDSRLRPHLHEIAVLFNEPEFVKDDLANWTTKVGGPIAIEIKRDKFSPMGGKSKPSKVTYAPLRKLPETESDDDQCDKKP